MNLWRTGREWNRLPTLAHRHDTLMDRPGADGEAYAMGWTISGLATLATILAVWIFVI